jgi:Spy/CpxP family protein refolding chaperone
MKRLLASALVLAAAVGAVAASRESEPKSRGRAGRDKVLKEDVGLSDEQVSRLEDLRRDTAKARMLRRADLRVARMELRDALDAPALDEKAVEARLRHLNELRGAALRAQVESRLAMRRIVSAEQYRKIEEQRRERRGVRRERLERRRARDHWRSERSSAQDEEADDARDEH